MTFFMKSPRHFSSNFAATQLRSGGKPVISKEQPTPWRGFQISRDLSASREHSHQSAQKPSLLEGLLPALQRIAANRETANDQLLDPSSQFHS